MNELLFSSDNISVHGFFRTSTQKKDHDTIPFICGK